MKFAHTFNETLSSENFPPEWQAAAIRYRQLKKCIKRVKEELDALGLDVQTLKELISECREGGAATGAPTLQYMFDGTIQSFQPKLVLTVRGSDGLPLDLGLSDETRQSLERLLQQRGTRPRPLNRRSSMASSQSDSSSDSSPSETSDVSAASITSASDVESSHYPLNPESVSTIEIPLNHDSEFFRDLAAELLVLGKIQSNAAKTIESEIVAMGDKVIVVATPQTSTMRRSDLYPWREIFRIYLETGIFFSTLEIEGHKERTVEDAQARLEKFLQEVDKLGLRTSFKQRNSHLLFNRFVAINEEVLRVLRFQAINKMAMTKILKKFDKRTALGARETFPTFVASNPFLASQLSKAICFTMSNKLLTIIPQLEDYLCPICQSISVKPVRLSCAHVFCVRCLVKLQREVKRFCPMCRGDVVMQADATNLDMSLLNFLKTYFPREAREKQRENENEVVQEQWRNVQLRTAAGEAMGSDAGCVVM
ncbi:SPX domain-containing protein [Sphaerosporella brunnea]|uniref:SPX domain-containing protein n=1 Tax=Sphaerosporella brunnea TaxID=1250544 RepID=A0A5J5F9D3_9PEZI|nr:SPX domain-containing protein [Sphaerosporella brunnea]